jgi:hypothetical protein
LRKYVDEKGNARWRSYFNVEEKTQNYLLNPYHKTEDGASVSKAAKKNEKTAPN